MKDMSKTTKFLEILQTGRNISLAEAMSELKTTCQGIYTVANSLRKRGYRIKSKKTEKGHVYYLNLPSSLPVSYKANVVEDQHQKKTNIFFGTLSDTDKQEYFEYVKKSCFYKLCASALIDSNIEAQKICTKGA